VVRRWICDWILNPESGIRKAEIAPVREKRKKIMTEELYIILWVGISWSSEVKKKKNDNKIKKTLT
jgi:hypothetical protein